MYAPTLLPIEALVKTGDVDHADWNFKGLLGYVSRQRFRMAIELMPPGPNEKLLELGYGSGVFMPELRRHARALYGADVHDRTDDVEAKLRLNGIDARLVTAPAESLPFDDETFDVVVAISTFEFVTDPVAATEEIARVLKPNGCAIVVTPGISPILDFALWAATGADVRNDFGKRREAVIPALTSRLRIDHSLAFPLSSVVTMYRALRLVKAPSPAKKPLSARELVLA